MEANNDLPAALALAEKTLRIHEALKQKGPNYDEERKLFIGRVVKLKDSARALQERIGELEAKKGKDPAIKANKADLKKVLHG